MSQRINLSPDKRMLNHTTCASFAEINLNALEENLLQVRSLVGNRPILAVVKANAYGHGATRVAQFLERGRVKVAMFGVAFLEEGIALREAGVRRPILLLTGCPIQQIPDVLQGDLTPVVFDLETLSAISQYARKIGKHVKIHVKIDTGMGRLGVLPTDFLSFLEKVFSYEMISVEGILTHFAEADLDDLSFAQKQLDVIKYILAVLAEKGVDIPLCHLANSAAILNFEPAHLDLVRPGLMLYGYSPLRGENPLSLEPVMQVKARIIALKKVSKGTPISYGRTFVTDRESLIATVGIGYADGYPFSLSNRAFMLVNRSCAPVVGRVCMDMTMLDVSEVPELSIGDWVTVMGVEGDQSVWADRLSEWAKTHPYEILCGIGTRVQRRYIEV